MADQESDLQRRERLQREEADVESRGEEWRFHSDAFLVGWVTRNQGFHPPAIVEMQRRQMVAVREFNEQSGKQTETVIYLTKWIIGLTVALGAIAVVQLVVMLRGGG